MLSFLSAVAEWFSAKFSGADAVITYLVRNGYAPGVILGIIAGCIGMWGIEAGVRILGAKNGWMRGFRHGWLTESKQQDGPGYALGLPLSAICGLILVVGLTIQLLGGPRSIGSTTVIGAALYAAVFGSYESVVLLGRLGLGALAWSGRAWRWCGGKLRLYRESAQTKQAKERELSGADVAEQFDVIRAELVGMIGESAYLSTLKVRIDQLVSVELQKYLNLRRYLTENLPAVRKVVESVGDVEDGKMEGVRRSRDILCRLEAQLVEINKTIERMRVTLEHMKPVVVESLAGLSSQQTMAEGALQEIDEFVTVMGDSVHGSMALDAAEAEMRRELAPVADVNQAGDEARPAKDAVRS